MRTISTRFIQGLAALLLIAGATGCDTFELFDRDKEVTGIITEMGDNYVVVDNVKYVVNGNTEFEGIDGLEDLSVGDEVGIEYEGDGSERTALEIEKGDNEDDDGGLFD